GQYGAGTVIVWDRGTWAPVGDPREGYKAGKLKFEMRGEKLRGRWTLVRMRGKKGERHEPWLLIKETDAEARPASEFDIVEEQPDSVMEGKAKGRARNSRAQPKQDSLPEGAVAAKLPLALHPQLATLVDKPPAGAGWTYEVKFDGYRLLARIDGDDVRLFTRNGNDWTARLKALRDEVRALGFASGWLDGEIVMLNAQGNPDFQALQNAFDSSTTGQIVYFVFDAPHFGGYDLTRVPLASRRELLAAALADKASERIRYSESFDAPVAKLLEGACRKGLEGLIGKRADAPYSSRRSPAWIKLKCARRQEFVIAGYTDPKGSRVGFGALLLGVHDAEGRLTYAGNVGTGFDDKLLASLLAKLRALATPKSPFDAPPRGVKGHWVRPKLIAEVGFTEWTVEGRVRHPVFHGLRTDKEPRAITREEAKHVVEAPQAKRSSPVIKVTHPERVIDPKSKATKGDLVSFYARVAEHMLPHLVRRPVALVRGPTGVGGELFFQKHGEKLGIPGIRTLDPALWPGHAAMIEVDTVQALVGAAQMNVIELHTWNSTTKAIAKPDRVIFDLDPGEGVGWETVKEATALTHKMLELLGVESFLKTSGGKGLHVVVPLKPKWDYDAVKDFSEAVVKHLAATLPKLFVSKSGARNRVGRIFVDYLRNGRGATTAAAFSARARPGLGVSVPVTWEELAGLESADQWNIFNIDERLKVRTDPWKDYESSRQVLDAALRKLARE
nr:DNA ligase D [Pseudomonadota bacterium]